MACIDNAKIVAQAPPYFIFLTCDLTQNGHLTVRRAGLCIYDQRFIYACPC
jgi:hypothetical protein